MIHEENLQPLSNLESMILDEEEKKHQFYYEDLKRKHINLENEMFKILLTSKN